MSIDQKSLLLIDSNDITRRLLVGLLTNKGYQVHESADFSFAAPTTAFQLALVDVDANPNQAAALVKNLSASLPVILLSDAETSQGVQAARAHGSFTVLSKPITPDNLLAEVARVMKPGAARPVHRWQDLDPDEEAREQRRIFMRRAIDLSQIKMQENAGGPFGAVIVRQGKIIGEGWNSVTSLNDPTAHAEVMAIRAACENIGHFSLEGCEIYTSCEPCPMCLAAIYWARIDRVFYANTRDDAAEIGFDDEFIYREVALPFEKRTMPCFMMLRDEAQIVFGAWDDRKDKTPY